MGVGSSLRSEGPVPEKADWPRERGPVPEEDRVGPRGVSWYLGRIWEMGVGRRGWGSGDGPSPGGGGRLL